MNVLYAGEPTTVSWWSHDDASAETAIAGVVEIAETDAGSLVMRTDVERVLCPAGTWGRIAWPVDAGARFATLATP